MTTNLRGCFSGVRGYYPLLSFSVLLLQAGCELNKDGSLALEGPLQYNAEAFKDLSDMTDAELNDYCHRLRARLNKLESSDDLGPGPFRDDQMTRTPPSRDDSSELRSISEKLAEVQAEMESRKPKVR